MRWMNYEHLSHCVSLSNKHCQIQARVLGEASSILVRVLSKVRNLLQQQQNVKAILHFQGKVRQVVNSKIIANQKELHECINVIIVACQLMTLISKLNGFKTKAIAIRQELTVICEVER